MKPRQHSRQMGRSPWQQWGLSLLLSVTLGLASWMGMPGASWAGLAQGDAITDPKALLQYALPIDNDTVRRLQGSLEEIAIFLRGKRWSGVSKDIKTAKRVLDYKQDDLLASIDEAQQPAAQALLEGMVADLQNLEEAAIAKDTEMVWQNRRKILDQVGELESLMVKGFPFEVPEEYAQLPQLKGRATVKLTTTQGDITIVADGYSAPVNAGNFVDLVNRGFYDGLPITRAEDFVVQAGDPKGEATGFIDPKTGEYRAIPLEVLVKGEEAPFYGETLEDMGIYLAELAIPFNAYGAVALARPIDDPNGGSSQFFFFKFDRELTPPGYNLMDGRYSVFGYTTEGEKLLEELTPNDKIIKGEVVSGLENLQTPS